jgi:S-adenosylmethionine hydrolase
VRILLFTDFGAGDLYVGQVHAVLAAAAPGVPVIDLLHAAPRFDSRAGAHLLAALAGRLPGPDVIMAVVDPGERWLVGPDNGLLSVAAARAGGGEVHEIAWRPQRMSDTFHGRDLFAPVAARLARGAASASLLAPRDGFDVELGGGDLSEIIYLDHYGNAVTGLRADNLAREARLRVAGRSLPFIRTFGDAAPGIAFWYEGSLGLAEIAVNGGSAAAELALAVGQPVAKEV